MSRRDWRVRRDARISRCPGCDGLVWDGACGRCAPVDISVARGAKHALTWDNEATPGALGTATEGLTNHHLLAQGGDRL